MCWYLHYCVVVEFRDTWDENSLNICNSYIVGKAVDNPKGVVCLPTKVWRSCHCFTGGIHSTCRIFNIKAERLQNMFAKIGKRYDGSLDAMMEEETETLRHALLSVKGIGPETADSILLYVAERPVFVVDTYTYRILLRHNLIPDDFNYDEIQEFFMDNL